MPRSRIVPLFFLIILIGVSALTLSKAALTWDGSFYLYRGLTDGSPLIPNNRLIHLLIPIPALIVARFTTNADLVSTVFTLIYAIMPLIGLIGAWHVTRGRADRLLIWCALGICICVLPGQIGLISEGAISLQLCWAMFATSLLGVRHRDLIVLIPAGLITAVTHPANFLIFWIAAGLTWSVAIYDSWRKVRLISPHPKSLPHKEGGTLFARSTFLPFPLERGKGPGEGGFVSEVTIRTRWITGAVFFACGALALTRAILIANPYEAEQLSAEILSSRFISAVLGAPFAGIQAALLGSALLLVGWRRIALFVFGVSLLTFAYYGWTLRSWSDALNFRFFVIPLTAPFVLLMLIDYIANRRTLPTVGTPRAWGAALLLIGLIFTVTVTGQSITWTQTTRIAHDLLRQERSACLSTNDPRYDWLPQSPLNHWSITPLMILMDGQQPSQILRWRQDCTSPDAFTDGLPVTDWYTRYWRWPPDWFDYTTIRARLNE